MIFDNRKQLAQHKDDGTERFKCHRCGKVKRMFTDPTKTHFPEYGANDAGELTCWKCCGEEDRKYMIEHGKIDLYLNRHEKEDGKWPEITDWPGTLRFSAMEIKRSHHNIGTWRYDVWFVGPDKYVWHGVQIGAFNEICHCKRTKEKWSKGLDRG